MPQSVTPLVMIHGLLGSIDYFEPQSYLKDFEVHTPHLPGYGRRATNHGGSRISLTSQALWVLEYLSSEVGRPAWLLGHSVGGAIAMLAAHLGPEQVRGVINVEGNFTLNDAFWCRKIAPLTDEAWAADYERMKSDPLAWLRGASVEVTVKRLGWAHEILHHQPASTVLAMARAVVEETSAPRYLEAVHEVVTRGTALHLLAGACSAPAWDVPAWVRSAARGVTELAGTGHLMMLESPRAFCEAVQCALTMTGSEA